MVSSMANGPTGIALLFRWLLAFRMRVLRAIGTGVCTLHDTRDRDEMRSNALEAGGIETESPKLKFEHGPLRPFVSHFYASSCIFCSQARVISRHVYESS